MLTLALALLCAAAALGGILFVLYLGRAPGSRPALPVVAGHMAFGIAGLLLLLLALWRGLPPSPMGTGGFGIAAAVLLLLTLVAGLVLADAAWRRRRPAALLVGTHATLAIAALTLLLALVVLG